MNFQDTNQDDNKTSKSVDGFFASLIESLFKSNNPEVEKKRKLKNIAKSLAKTKFHNYYKASTIEIMPSLAKLFYDIYKIVSPAQLLFKATPNINVFKNQILNFCMSTTQLELIEHFDERKIAEVCKQVPLANVKTKIEQELMTFSNEFDIARVNKTENLYKAFTLFKDFCLFDFYYLLRKFNSTIQENTFTSTPTFEKINAEYILDDLKDFVAVAYAITDESISWNALFDFFKSTHNSEFVSANTWKKIIAKIKAIQTSNAFELIIKHISKNPKYQTDLSISTSTIVEPFVDKITDDTKEILTKLENAQKESRATSICHQIFDGNNLEQLKNYTESYNSIFQKKELLTFDYSEPLTYLKTFLLNYVKKEIRELFDIVVIRGQWDASLSAPMSNAYQDLLKSSVELLNFDASLAEDGPLGSKIKNLLPKTNHDAGAENIINRVIIDSNDQAKNLIFSCTQNLIIIGKTLKQLIEDYVKPKHIIVQNWRELEKFSEIPLKDFCVDVYKKIYLFVQLMQPYLSE